MRKWPHDAKARCTARNRKSNFCKKIWPLCAVLSKSGGRGQTSGKTEHIEKETGSKDVDVPFYVFISHIYLCMRLLRLHMAFSAPCIFTLAIFILLFYLIDMVQVPSFRNKNVLEEKVWPSYRGKRAGKQAKERALLQAPYRNHPYKDKTSEP